MTEVSQRARDEQARIAFTLAATTIGRDVLFHGLTDAEITYICRKVIASTEAATPTAEAGLRSTFRLGDRVEKVGGASWRGLIVGTYSTKRTPEGYAVESENEPGSVQIYPVRALKAALQTSAPGGGK